MEVRSLATADLLAVRALLKYSPDQPRDDQGRWTVGEAMNEWEQGAHDIRASIAAGSPNPAAQALLGELARQKDGNAPTLYRGVVLTPQALAEMGIKAPAIAAADLHAGDTVTYEAGKTFDLNLSSFTSTMGYGSAFATGFADDYPGRLGLPVLFSLEGATALRMSGKDSIGNPRSLEREWVTGGRFSISSARVNDISYTIPISSDRGRATMLQVFIRQEAKLGG